MKRILPICSKQLNTAIDGRKDQNSMVDRLYRDSSSSSMQNSEVNPSFFLNSAHSKRDGALSNSGHPSIAATIQALPRHIQEIITDAKSFQNMNQKLQHIQQDIPRSSLDTIAHAALLADLTQKISQIEVNLLFSPRKLPDHAALSREVSRISSVSDGQFSLTEGELLKLRLLPAKRPSLSSCEEPVLKRTRPDENCKADVTNAGIILPLSASERKATFPLPPLSGSVRRLPRVNFSSTLQQSWEKFEKISDAMDDTAADQEAFVKKLFVRSLHRYGLSHLTERIQKYKSDAVPIENKNASLKRSVLGE